MAYIHVDLFMVYLLLIARSDGPVVYTRNRLLAFWHTAVLLPVTWGGRNGDVVWTHFSSLTSLASGWVHLHLPHSQKPFSPGKCWKQCVICTNVSDCCGRDSEQRKTQDKVRWKNTLLTQSHMRMRNSGPYFSYLANVVSGIICRMRLHKWDFSFPRSKFGKITKATHPKMLTRSSAGSFSLSG